MVAIFVLILLFIVQRRGTEAVGKFFGPIIGIWFVVLGITGVLQILEAPAILAALNPLFAIQFLIDRGPMVLAAVGAIVLALTGAEALYADMGHFERKPIQIAWIGLVMPSLAIHYLGQGALLISQPEAIENPFFKMFPEFLLIPAVVLATMAAIIASQAVISGAYSMSKQAILLGFLPRMQIKHTSELDLGQIYVPAVNWALLVGVIIAVLGFQSSSALAGAYGIAVTLTMLITTIMTFFVIRSLARSRGQQQKT
jgi:KUP system potassium uptake protein